MLRADDPTVEWFGHFCTILKGLIPTEQVTHIATYLNWDYNFNHSNLQQPLTINNNLSFFIRHFNLAIITVKQELKWK
jgi:hypothetical protein